MVGKAINTNSKKILILVPGQNARGGITNYYQTLKPIFSLSVDYFERGARNWPQKKSIIQEWGRIVRDTCSFLKTVRRKKYVLMQTTTSFSSSAILRDSIFILIARFFKIKTIVFIRGWDYKFAEKIEKKHLKFFKKIYFKVDGIIDLSNKNIEILQKWGYKGPLFLESTLVDEELIKGVNKEFVEERLNKKNICILYLARLEKTKGIYEAIDTYSIIKAKHPNAKMIIAGDGREENSVKKYISDKRIKDITLLGFVEGETKRQAYQNGDIYLFPSYFEGMPNSVLEAMAFGLPVVTRAVGGLVDFFKDERNGFITESYDPEVLSSFVERIISNEILAKEIALNNYQYARDNFTSAVVVKRIEHIFNQIINK